MDGHAAKLAKRYKITPQQATTLVEAGFKSPKDIIKANKADLQALEGIGPATLKKLRLF